MMPPAQTLRQQLDDQAKRGLLNFRLSRAAEDLTQWKAINMILDACNNDNIIVLINQYIDKEEIGQ